MMQEKKEIGSDAKGQKARERKVRTTAVGEMKRYSR